jgi:hypothetical protein
MKTFDISTSSKEAFIDITAKVEEEIRRARVEAGVCLVYIPHTTAGVTINENADPTVRQDVLMILRKRFPTLSLMLMSREILRLTSRPAWSVPRSLSSSRLAGWLWGLGRASFSASSMVRAGGRSILRSSLAERPIKTGDTISISESRVMSLRFQKSRPTARSSFSKSVSGL